MKVLPIGLFCLFLIGGCASFTATHTKKAPVDSLSADSAKRHHLVLKGDTLYSIAFRYGWDHQDLAELNHIKPPYDIQIGQVIYLVAQKTKPERAKNTRWAQKKAEVAPIAKTSPRVSYQVSDATPSAFDHKGTEWHWPSKGKILKRFQEGRALAKGIDIAGTRGTPIYAAGEGVVVYAGSGLRGFGELIILKHDNDFLSAYAHNNTILVSEGMKVKAGQQIADMGDSGAERVKLHFEIRRKGRPVDPLRYLPAS